MHALHRLLDPHLDVEGSGGREMHTLGCGPRVEAAPPGTAPWRAHDRWWVAQHTVCPKAQDAMHTTTPPSVVARAGATAPVWSRLCFLGRGARGRAVWSGWSGRPTLPQDPAATPTKSSRRPAAAVRQHRIKLQTGGPRRLRTGTLL